MKEAGSQTLFAYGSARWYVEANHSRTDIPVNRRGSIKSYPCTQKNFDRPIDSFSKIRSSWSTTCPASGEWNASYDIWINGFGKGSTAEVMIWTDHRYPARIPPSNAAESAKVTIDGRAFTAWRRESHPGGSYIALVLDTKAPAGKLDLLAVFDWLVGKGWLKGTDKISAIEYGIEIANTVGPQRFHLNDFTLITE